MRQGFERVYPVNIPCTNHIKLRAQKCLHPTACINDMAGLFVHISVHGHLDVGMPGNGLKRFDVSTRACRIGEIAVPEDMSGSIMKVDLFPDTVHPPFV